MVKTIGEVEAAGFINKFDEVVTVRLDVTTASSTADLSSLTECNTITIQNVGTTDCYITLTNTATTNGLLLEPDVGITLKNVNFDNVSAITSAATTTVNVIAQSGNTGQKTNSEILVLAVTDASSEDSFTDTTAYKDILILNEGATDCYINLGATATTSDILLKSKEVIMIENADKHQISAICAAAGTTTVKALGVW